MSSLEPKPDLLRGFEVADKILTFVLNISNLQNTVSVTTFQSG